MTKEEDLIMTKEEWLIRQIIGTSRRKTNALACAIRIAHELIFEQGRTLNDIQVSKDIYPAAARMTGQSPGAASRQITRLANYCWDQMNEQQKEQLIGQHLEDIPFPRDILIYFAFYCHNNEPFFKRCEKEQPLSAGKKPEKQKTVKSLKNQKGR